jgi:hypothetical protein
MMTAFIVGKWYAPQKQLHDDRAEFVPVKVLRRTPKQIVFGYKSENLLNQRRKFEVVDGVEIVCIFGICYSADMPEPEGVIT